MALSLGLAGVLNNVTAPRTGNASLTKIERVELIPLKSLKSHPDNFYKLSDIEALAKLILLNKEIDTLTVKHNQETNDYTVISGHRRMAAVAWLVEHGKITEEEAKLPCKIVSKPSIDFFTEEEAEQFKIIAGNIGQRKYTTVDTIQEIVKTEPEKSLIIYQKRKEKAFWISEIILQEPFLVNHLPGYKDLSLLAI